MVFISASLAQEFYEILNNVLDQPTLTRMNLADLGQTQIKLSSAYTYQDYFRESISGKDTQTLFGGGVSINLRAVNASRTFKYGIILQIKDRRDNYSNLNSDLFINTDYLNEGRSLDLQMALSKERMLWGCKIDRHSETYTAPLQISEYPESEDSQMNRYFLDWLEPSFGNELDINGTFDLTGLQTFTSLPLGADLLLNLNYRVSETTFEPHIDYINSSNIDELRGTRQMVFDGANDNQFLEISLEKPQWSFKPTLTLQRNIANLTIENPLPEGVIDDFPELGWLNFSRRGGAFSLENQLENLDLKLGVGYSQWEANTEISTPVLGRYWFFPIAHAAQLHISGKSISQHLSLHRELINRGIGIDFKVAYQHAYFDFMVRGEAELEFNIRSVPIHDPLQFHLHTISIGIPIRYTTGSFALQYDFNQTIPWLKRVDDSPFNFQGDGPQPDRKVRGGGQHMIALSYKLN